MELDDLKTSWKALDRKVDELASMQRAMRRTTLQDAARGAARRQLAGPWLEIACAVILLLFIPGGFLADNIAQVRNAPLSALPAAVLFLTGIAIVVIDAYRLALLRGIDFTRPIVDAQRAVARLAAAQVRSTQVLLLGGVALWVVLPLFAGQLLFGVAFVSAVPGAWLAANLAFGLLFALGVVFAAHRLGARSPVMRAIDDAFAGREIVRLRALLADLAEFERA